MADESIEGLLWIWTAGEVLVLLVLLWIFWGSVFGNTGAVAWLSRPVRMAAVVVIVVQLLVPVWVFVDLRRRFDDPSYMWVHVAAMPVLNVFGLLGYLEERRRAREGRWRVTAGSAVVPRRYLHLRTRSTGDRMDRSGFVKLSMLAFGLILLSFVILGFSRILLPYRTARVLSAPTMLLAATLVAYLFVRAFLSWTGVRRIE